MEKIAESEGIFVKKVDAIVVSFQVLVRNEDDGGVFKGEEKIWGASFRVTVLVIKA